MPSDERDRQFEQALQKHLRSGAPDAACPDAETLAAYHERTLSLEELTHWKEHISACARCQETLALLEETNAVALEEWQEQDLVAQPGQEAIAGAVFRGAPRAEMSAPVMAASAKPTQAPVKIRTHSTWKWIAPVGALAAGLLIFVALREKETRMASTAPAVQVAENRDEMSGKSKLAKPEKPQLMEKSEDPARAKRDEGKQLDDRAAAVKKLASPSAAAKHSGVSSQAPAAKEADKLKQQEETTSKGVDLDALRPKPKMPEVRQPSAIISMAAPSAAPPSVNAPIPAAGAAVGGTAAVAKRADSEERKADAAATSSVTVMQQMETSPTTAADFSRVDNGLRQAAAANSHMILAPDAKHAWRVGTMGMIENTSDGGTHWKAQKSGVNGELTSGSAPSERVCWIVGKAGIILLTTDGGKHWKSITSPLQEDLGRVHAVDANHAAIWNVANRKTFETTDGGVTWSASANE